MATVLFAVAMSIAAVRKQMPIIPPRRLVVRFRINSRIASKPPFSLIRAQRADTIKATMVVSYMEATPDPAPLRSPTGVFAPVRRTMTDPLAMPRKSTAKTLSPVMPQTSTST